MVLDGDGARGEYSLTAELRFKLDGQEVLELVGLASKCVGLEPAEPLRSLGDDFGSGCSESTIPSTDISRSALTYW
jgi:hypothetical protein